MNELIERAGKALAEAEVDTDTFHHDYDGYWAEQYNQIVRVVVQEMRKPSIEMMVAMAGQPTPDGAEWLATLMRYQRAIDAVLGDVKQEA